MASNFQHIFDVETTGIRGFKEELRRSTDVRIHELSVLNRATGAVETSHVRFMDHIVGGIREGKYKTGQELFGALQGVGWQQAILDPNNPLRVGLGASLAAHARGETISAGQMLGKVASLQGGLAAYNKSFDVGMLAHELKNELGRNLSDEGAAAFKHAAIGGQLNNVVDLPDPLREVLFQRAFKGNLPYQYIDKATKDSLAQKASLQKAVGAKGVSAIDEFVATMSPSSILTEHEGLGKALEAYRSTGVKKASLAGFQEFLQGQGGSKELLDGLFKKFGGVPDPTYTAGWSTAHALETLVPGSSTNIAGTPLENLLGVGELHASGYDVRVEDLIHRTYGDVAEVYASGGAVPDSLKSLGIKSWAQFETQQDEALVRISRRKLAEALKSPERLGYYDKSGQDKAYQSLMDFARQAVLGEPDPVVPKATKRRMSDVGFDEVKSWFRQAPSEIKEWWGGKSANWRKGVAITAGVLAASSTAGIEYVASAFSRGFDANTPTGPSIPFTDTFGRMYSNLTAKSVNQGVVEGSMRSPMAAETAILGHTVLSSKEASAASGIGITSRALSEWEGTTRKLSEVGMMGMDPGSANDAVQVINANHYDIKAYDADTVELYSRYLPEMMQKPVRIRLSGVDAPETSQPGGLAAGEYLQGLIDQGKVSQVVVRPDKITYGRYLGALVGPEGENINLGLVGAGAAMASPSFIAEEALVSGDQLLSAENAAAGNQTGMWALKPWMAAKAIADMTGQRPSNVTFADPTRLAGSSALRMQYGLLEQTSKTADQEWSENETRLMEMIATVRRNKSLDNEWGIGLVNEEIKHRGFRDGIRMPTSSWDRISAINPGYGLNLSSFGSGRHIDPELSYVPNPAYADNGFGMIDLLKLGLWIKAPAQSWGWFPGLAVGQDPYKYAKNLAKTMKAELDASGELGLSKAEVNKIRKQYIRNFKKRFNKLRHLGSGGKDVYYSILENLVGKRTRRSLIEKAKVKLGTMDRQPGVIGAFKSAWVNTHDWLKEGKFWSNIWERAKSGTASIRKSMTDFGSKWSSTSGYKPAWQQLWKELDPGTNASFASKAKARAQFLIHALNPHEALAGLEVPHKAVPVTKDGYQTLTALSKDWTTEGRKGAVRWLGEQAGKVSKYKAAQTAVGVAKRIPLLNSGLALGLGFLEAGSYQSPVRGFMVETAAAGVELAAFSVTWGASVGGKALGGAAGGAVGGALAGTAIAPIIGTAVGFIAGMIASSVVSMAAGEITRSVASTLTGAQKRINYSDVYVSQDNLYNSAGFASVSGMGPTSFEQVHGIPGSRPDLTPFGGPTKPLRQALGVEGLVARKYLASPKRAQKPSAQFRIRQQGLSYVHRTMDVNSVRRKRVMSGRFLRDRSHYAVSRTAGI